MNLIFLPPTLFALSGIHLSRVFGDTGLLWLYFCLAGILLNFFFTRKIKIEISRFPVLIFIASFLLALLLPFPFKIGPLLLLFSFLFLYFGKKMKGLETLSKGLFLSGVEFSLILLFIPLLNRTSAYIHDIAFSSSFFSGLFKISGYQSYFSSGTIFVRTMRDLMQLTPRFESLGIYLFSLLLPILVLLFALSGKKLKHILLALTVLIFYIVFRFFFWGALYFEAQDPSVFYKEPFLSLSFIPLIFFLGLFKFEEVKFFFEREKNLYTFLTFALVSSSVLFLSFHDPGVPKKGRILIDEFHSDWEWTTRKYDTEWYGPQSGYNYYCYADFLNHYFVVKSSFEPISKEALKDVDVLIIKTPTKEFTPDEIDAICNFVKKGGGVFVIGDHTNVFGSTTYLNPLLKRFSLSLNYDATYHLKTLDFTIFRPSKLFPHPAVRGMKYLLFATSCTANGNLFSDPVMIGGAIRSLYLDYSKVSFFPDRDKTKDYGFGNFLQAVSVKYGKGRVLLFTDSTVFSNFYVFFAGRPEFALFSIKWLNRTNRFFELKGLFLLLAFFSLMAMLILALLKREKVFASLTLGTLFAILFTLSFIRAIDAVSTHKISPRTPYTKIAFEKEHSNFVMPLFGFQNFSEKSYHTFFLWTQRLGYVPSIFDQIDDALMDSDLSVIINPSTTFSKREIRKLEDFLSEGGKVLLIFNPSGYTPPARELAERFGFKLKREIRLFPEVHDKEGNFLLKLQKCGIVEGGNPVLFADEGIPILSYTRVGKGIFAIFTSFSGFSDKEMGDYNVIPDEKQRKLHELEYWLINSLLRGNFDVLPKD